MKQRVLSLVVALIATTVLWAYDFKSGDLYYNILSENTVEVTYELSYGGSSYVNDFNLTHVIIPAMVINDGITYDVIRIGEYAFNSCGSLTSITIPNSVTSIGHGAFEGTSWFASLPDDLVYINNILYTYKGIMPENTSIVVKEGTTSICDFAFDYQHHLSSIIIPNGVTDIGDYAFSQCQNLIDITIPQSVINIGQNAFADTPWFDSLPNGLVYINEVLYTYKDSLPDNTSLVISDSTKSISSGAFSNCAGLNSIYIPKNVTHIGDGTFSGCKNLSSIVVDSENAIYDSRNNCNAIIETKSSVLIAGCQTTIIPDDVTRIGKAAFAGCNIKEINLPNVLAGIEDGAFFGCDSLTSIVVPNKVTRIGSSAFAYCDNLVSVTMGDNVKTIDSYAFIDCNDLSNVVLNGCINTIGYSAFYGCNITSISLPDSLKYINDLAFCRCHNLSSITIPRNVSCIRGDVFGLCENLKSIVVNNENTVFDSRNNCNAIIETATNTLVVGCQTTTIPDGVMHIGRRAFPNNCKDSIVFPQSVVSIGYDAFGSCTNLTFITIPKNVTDIGSSAFDGCSNLKKIVIETTNPPVLEKWGETDRVFEDCPVDTIYIPCGTKEAYTSIHWGGFDDDKFVEMECPTSGKCGDNLYWSYADDTLSITGTGDMYDYAADSANTAPWLLFRDSITTITFPEGITYIGTHAFRQLPLLTEVTVPNAVEEIGESAFAECAGLGKVMIGSGNSSRLTAMGDSVFIHSRKLYEIHIAATEPPIADRTTFLNHNVHLYVPCESKDKYDLDMVFGDFKYIECLDTDTPVENFSVTPAQTSAKFVWGAPSNAATYTLDLQQEDAPFFTLVFNATGQLHSICLAPIGSQVRLTAAERIGSGFTFNATGLTPRTLYNYDLTIRDAAEVALQNYSGYFYTTSDIPTGTEDVDDADKDNNAAIDDTTPRKVFRNGQVLILRGGKTYTLTGEEVE